MHSSPVIITSKDPLWTNGLGTLHEPFEEDAQKYKYCVLQVLAAPHRKTGYYLVTITKTHIAELMLINPDGDQMGFSFPLIGPTASVEEATSYLQHPVAPEKNLPGPELTLDQLITRKMQTPKPLIYCLCGSTCRAEDAFKSEQLRLTLDYQIVLTIGANTKDTHLSISEEQKNQLDLLHLYKIELADIVRFLNVGGYIGASTRRELEYARRLNKRIEFLEEPE
jgi:hypothetical protein